MWGKIRMLGGWAAMAGFQKNRRPTVGRLSIGYPFCFTNKQKSCYKIKPLVLLPGTPRQNGQHVLKIAVDEQLAKPKPQAPALRAALRGGAISPPCVLPSASGI